MIVHLLSCTNAVHIVNLQFSPCLRVKNAVLASWWVSGWKHFVYHDATVIVTRFGKPGSRISFTNFLSRQDKSSFLCFILSGQKKLASISFQLHSPVPVFLFLDSFIPLFETNGLNTQLKLYMCYSQTILFLISPFQQ